MAVKALDKMKLLDRLEKIKHQKEAQAGDEDFLRQMNLGGVLLELAGINHESEYKLCRSIAEHMIGKVPEPDEIETDES